jgi:hypothetical protein
LACSRERLACKAKIVLGKEKCWEVKARLHFVVACSG